MSEPKGATDERNRWVAGKVAELMGSLHPDDEALVLEHLGYNKLDSGTIDPPPTRKLGDEQPRKKQ